VKDAKYRSLAEAPQAVFYEPLDQTFSAQMTLLARCNGDPRLLIEPVRREIRSLNPDLAAITIRTLEDQFRESTAPSRQRAIIMSACCGTGLLLSAFGLFGVLSYAVRQQVREHGIRMALGARPVDIGLMVFGQAFRLVGTGLAIGLVLAAVGARLISSALFGVTAYDPLTWCTAVLLLACVAGGSAYLPARWAMRASPMASIRAG
jgi:ABC-type antimicrobial peptide transport system permease subunit